MKFLDAVGPIAISKSVWSQLLDENEKGRSVTSFQDVSLDGRWYEKDYLPKLIQNFTNWKWNFNFTALQIDLDPEILIFKPGRFSRFLDPDQPLGLWNENFLFNL